MAGPEDYRTYEQMTTAELEELLLQNFQTEGDGGADALLSAAEELARREPPAGDAERAWKIFREKYLPFAGDGSSLYEDPEPPAGSDAAFKPRHPRLAALRRGLGRIAAVFLLTVLLGGGLFLAVDREGRAAFAGWVREIYSDRFFVYNYQGSDESAASVHDGIPYCHATWLPEDYELREVLDQSGEMVLIYENGEGQMISLQYTLSDVIGGLYIDEKTSERVKVRENWADFYPGKGEDELSILVWEDSGTKILFSLMGGVSREALLQMAESVEIIQPVYRPAWVPEGYGLEFDDTDSGDGGMFVSMLYTNEEGDLLTFMGCAGSSSPTLQVSGQTEITEERVLINGLPGDLYLDSDPDESNVLVWIDEGKGLFFTINGVLSREEMIQMAESVRPVPPELSPHRPGWLPAGYERFSLSGGAYNTELGYWDARKRDREEAVWFTCGTKQSLEQTRAEIEAALEGLEPQEVQAGEYPAQLYHDADGNGHLVMEREDKTIYWIRGPLSDEDLIRIAESVKTGP